MLHKNRLVNFYEKINIQLFASSDDGVGDDTGGETKTEEPKYITQEALDSAMDGFFEKIKGIIPKKEETKKEPEKKEEPKKIDGVSEEVAALLSGLTKSIGDINSRFDNLEKASEDKEKSSQLESLKAFGVTEEMVEELDSKSLNIVAKIAQGVKTSTEESVLEDEETLAKKLKEKGSKLKAFNSANDQKEKKSGNGLNKLQKFTFFGK